MIALLENAELANDMDAQGNDLLNIHEFLPVPENLVGIDDPRLADERVPLDGSVTDASVALNAGIIQSKLNLNGNIPTSWLGTNPGQAAAGDLAEYRLNKGVPNGYAELDSSGKVPVGQLPIGAGGGTITSIGLTMPAQFSVAGSPITVSGVLAVDWVNVPSPSWFGNTTGTTGQPTFNTVPIPAALIPDLGTNKIVSGVFPPARLPFAVGVGASHAPGIVPDPGASGNPTDYLARDMTYKPVPSLGPSYQPAVPDPVITQAAAGTRIIVYITDTLGDAQLMYALDAGAFAPFVGTYLPDVPIGTVVHAYAAAAGFNNSNIVDYTVQAPPAT